MIIKGYVGYELEKEKFNILEDFFNRFEVIYILNGKEKIFLVLYVWYFEEVL